MSIERRPKKLALGCFLGLPCGVRTILLKDIANVGGAPIGAADREARLAVFPALPPGNKYELVLDGAEHSVFTDRPLPGESGQRNPNHHRMILALTTAFWDAYLGSDAADQAWLDGARSRAVLDEADHWQKK